jgi:hypothetical protein
MAKKTQAEIDAIDAENKRIYAELDAIMGGQNHGTPAFQNIKKNNDVVNDTGYLDLYNFAKNNSDEAVKNFAGKYTPEQVKAIIDIATSQGQAIGTTKLDKKTSEKIIRGLQPLATDYAKVLEAKSQAKEDLIRKNPTTIDPYGTTTYDYETNTKRTTLSPEQQAVSDSQYGEVEHLKKMLQDDSYMNDYNNLQRKQEELYSTIGKSPYDSQYVNQIYQSYLDRISPEMESEQRALDTKAVNQGFSIGSPAHNSAFLSFQRASNNRKNDAYSQALDKGIGVEQNNFANKLGTLSQTGQTITQKNANRQNQIAGIGNFVAPKLGLQTPIAYQPMNWADMFMSQQQLNQNQGQFNSTMNFQQQQLKAQQKADEINGWGTIFGAGARTAASLYGGGA